MGLRYFMTTTLLRGMRYYATIITERFTPTTEMLNKLLVDLRNVSVVTVLGTGRFPDPTGLDESGVEALAVQIDICFDDRSEEAYALYVARLEAIGNQPSELMEHLEQRYFAKQPKG